MLSNNRLREHTPAFGGVVGLIQIRFHSIADSNHRIISQTEGNDEHADNLAEVADYHNNQDRDAATVRAGLGDSFTETVLHVKTIWRPLASLSKPNYL